MDIEHVAAALTALLPSIVPGATAIRDLRILTGGASMQTWSFDAVCRGDLVPLILRSAPQGERMEGKPGIAKEAQLIRLAQAAGVPVPKVYVVPTAGDGLGEAMIVGRLQGETLGGRIVKGGAFAPARGVLAAQCGAALARIHAVCVTDAPSLQRRDAAETLRCYREEWDGDPLPRPAIEAGFRWLADTMPDPVPLTIVHGDFRNGNLMVDPTVGLVGVLDWELAHFGDPAEDVGWLCVNSWRFGEVDRQVGGFGTMAELLTGYREAGGSALDPARVRWWQAMGSLKWAIISRGMYRAGGGTVERAVIGRRLSEGEADLVALMERGHE